MRIAAAVACALLLAGVPTPPAAAGIVRCEAADGRVTYSNRECPPETKAVRSVEMTPPVVVHGKDGAAAKPAGAGATAKPAAAGASAKPAAAGAAGRQSRNPAGDDAELRAQLAKQRAECDARQQEIERLRQQRDGAGGEARPAAQQALRRAEDDYRALCPRRR
jgi:hypothetical protein